MRPSFSIIVFTVLSGAGYGLLFVLGLHFAGTAGSTNGNARIAFGIPAVVGALLVSAGLLASVGHLGRPSRAWRAFSQWRSSWLSREGVAAIATYLPLALVAWWLFVPGGGQVAIRVGGALLAIGCLATVYCTAHIYSSLKPVRAWRNGYVLPGYLLLGLHAGLLWWIALAGVPVDGNHADAMLPFWLFDAILVVPACILVKLAYWKWLDLAERKPDAGDATGLGALGAVRSFERPHTEENYLTHEMGFVLARKHARRLRAIAVWTIVLAPFAIPALAWLIGWPASWIALAIGMLGIFVERWLFFAEARHAVIAYYGG
jgi:DMSO reductase anchor subunit